MEAAAVTGTLSVSYRQKNCDEDNLVVRLS